MADSKISALPAATVALAGTEVLPIVQSSTTKQVSVANLTAGRAISATQITLTTGNVIVANGQGIDFSATSGTGTSELLDDYEEGNFTPVIVGSTSAGTGTYNTQIGTYTKIGNRVFIQIRIDWSAHTGTGTTAIAGYPFTSSANTYGSFTVRFDSAFIVTVGNVPMCAFLPPSGTQGNLIQYELATGNSGTIPITSTGSITVNGHYEVA
jgi:hypothetical protein